MLSVKSQHSVLICREWEACVAFYRDVLGLPIVYQRNRFVEFEVTPDSRVGILEPLRPNAAEPGHEHVILSLCVPDIEEVHKKLEARTTDLPPIRKHPWGPRLFEIRDPEGWRIEFWEGDK